MGKIVLVLYSSLLFLMSCKIEKTKGTVSQRGENHSNKIENRTVIKSIVDCKNRLKEIVMSCGSGCALTLKEKTYEIKEKNTYRITFLQEMYINEQKSDQSTIEYYFLCNGKIIERVYDDETTNYLDENYSTPTQQISFKKYGESLCDCVN